MNKQIASDHATQALQPEQTTENKGRILSLFLWLLFFGNVTAFVMHYLGAIEWYQSDLFRVNSFTLLIWTTVTFFSAMVASYARNYLTGFRYHSKFNVLTVGFTLSVMLLVAGNHVILAVLSWGLMGYFMSGLIGVNESWGEAREARKITRKYFYTGTVFFGLGVALLSWFSGELTVSGIAAAVSDIPNSITLIAALCIILAAIVQSAMYPFQKWLLSAMTAPTPSSALMHAGFVNGGGILLALFATLIVSSHTMTFLFIIGGLTAVVAQFAKLLQVNVKHRLACSTIAQMGFMIMQCGLGFFNAAIAHLILHGFYKAYLFLSSGEEIAQSNPVQRTSISIKPLNALIVLVFGALGAWLFVLWTGKGFHLDSGLFLTLIVAIAVGQMTYNFLKTRSLSAWQKALFPPVLYVIGIGLYSLMYNGVTLLMADMPMSAHPVPLTGVQITFGFIFLIGFFIMKVGLYRNWPWMYVQLMNLTQPHHKSVLTYKSK